MFNVSYQKIEFKLHQAKLHALGAAIIFLASVLIFTPNTSSAATVIYDEFLDGELDGSQSFDLALGENVLYATNDETPDAIEPKEDFFFFNVGSGKQIESIFIETSNLEFVGNDVDFWIISIYFGGLDSGIQTNFSIIRPDNESSLVDSAFYPLPEDNYRWEMHGGHGGTDDELPHGVSFDYKLTFNVVNDGPPISPVPLPAALPLLVAGLGGLGWFGRKSKRA